MYNTGTKQSNTLPDSEVDAITSLLEAQDDNSKVREKIPGKKGKPIKRTPVRKEGLVKDWLQSEINKAIADLNLIDPETISSFEDAVMQTALAGQLGDGKPSGATSQAIKQLGQDLTASAPEQLGEPIDAEPLPDVKPILDLDEPIATVDVIDQEFPAIDWEDELAAPIEDELPDEGELDEPFDLAVLGDEEPDEDEDEEEEEEEEEEEKPEDEEEEEEEKPEDEEEEESVHEGVDYSTGEELSKDPESEIDSDADETTVKALDQPDEMTVELELNEEQQDAVTRFAEAIGGGNWKKVLMEIWETGDYPEDLDDNCISALEQVKVLYQHEAKELKAEKREAALAGREPGRHATIFMQEESVRFRLNGKLHRGHIECRHGDRVDVIDEEGVLQTIKQTDLVEGRRLRKTRKGVVEVALRDGIDAAMKVIRDSKTHGRSTTTSRS